MIEVKGRYSQEVLETMLDEMSIGWLIDFEKYEFVEGEDINTGEPRFFIADNGIIDGERIFFELELYDFHSLICLYLHSLKPDNKHSAGILKEDLEILTGKRKRA